MVSAPSSEGIAAYLRQLGRRKQLTREEEYELARRIHRGDERARHQLATSNLPFVVAVAKRYLHSGVRLEDLVQEGNLGLMKAIEHFDPKKDVRFATYAVWWIRAYITRHLKDVRSQVRGGMSERENPSDFSLDQTIGSEEGGDLTYLDRLQDDSLGPQESLLVDEQGERVRDALSRVRKRIGDLGWDILQERLTQDEPRTLEELGRRWGVSRERVRQVELRTKAFLARYLSAFNQDEETVEWADDQAA